MKSDYETQTIDERIGLENGLSPVWCQAIIWTNAVILSLGILQTNFREIFIEIQFFIEQNAVQIVVCKVVAILSQP